jgi:hypothetical protein
VFVFVTFFSSDEVCAAVVRGPLAGSDLGGGEVTLCPFGFSVGASAMDLDGAVGWYAERTLSNLRCISVKVGGEVTGEFSAVETAGVGAGEVGVVVVDGFVVEAEGVGGGGVNGFVIAADGAG